MKKEAGRSSGEMEKTIKDTIITYNFLAKSYADEWGAKPDLEIAEYFTSCLKKGDRILDVGCGPGHYSQLFFEKGFQVVGIDLSEGMLEQAKARLEQVIFYKMDMRELKFDDNFFDALWICASSPHIPKGAIFKALAEWKRVVKNDGLLFINAIIGDAPYRLEAALEIDKKYKAPGRFFQWYATQDEFENTLKEAGFMTFHIIAKMIHSNVVKHANHRVNYWVNYFCRPIEKV